MKDKLENYIHMIRKEDGVEEQQLTRPEPATSRSVAVPLAAEPRI